MSSSADQESEDTAPPRRGGSLFGLLADVVAPLPLARTLTVCGAGLLASYHVQQSVAAPPQRSALRRYSPGRPQKSGLIAAGAVCRKAGVTAANITANRRNSGRMPNPPDFSETTKR